MILVALLTLSLTIIGMVDAMLGPSPLRFYCHPKFVPVYLLQGAFVFLLVVNQGMVTSMIYISAAMSKMYMDLGGKEK